MKFSEKLRKLMADLDISQTKLSELTGVGKPSISQYLSGRHEPSEGRRREMALALGVQEDYFERFLPVAEIIQDTAANLPVDLVAKLMHKSEKFVRDGLIQGTCPFGYAVEMKEWSFYISPKLFTEFTGANLPLNETRLEKGKQA